MFSSVKIWPTNNCAYSFIPIIVGALPFQNLEGINVIEKKDVEECVSCHRPLDAYSRDGDKYKCYWCQKQIKPMNLEKAAKQCQNVQLLIREKREIQDKYVLVLALDGCSGSHYMPQLRQYLETAISSLPDDQPFHLAVIHRKRIT